LVFWADHYRKIKGQIYPATFPLLGGVRGRAFSFSKISSQFLEKSYVFSSLILLNSNLINSDFSGEQLYIFFELKNLIS
jgi:hypothetical protein